MFSYRSFIVSGLMFRSSLATFENRSTAPSDVSTRRVTLCPTCCHTCLCGCWCLAAAGITDVVCVACRAPECQVPQPCPGLPESWALPPWGEGENRDHRHLCYDWSWVHRCHCCCWVAESQRPLRLQEPGSQALLLLLPPCGHGCHCSGEAGVLFTASPNAAGLSGLPAQLLHACQCKRLVFDPWSVRITHAAGN